MNNLILGLPRNGKGLYTCQKGIEEIVHGDRPIIGNFAWEKMPWRTRKHELRCGLLSYLEQKHGDTFNAQERIFRISDDATARFYLYRALNGKTVKKLESAGLHLVGYRAVTPADGVMSETEFFLHKDYQLFVCDHEIKKDKNNRDVLVSFNPILLQHSGAHMNIADECWKFWPARGWQSTSECDVFYNAQHGKFGDDNFFVTHRHNDLDSVIVDRCQTSIVLTHHGKMRFGRFRRPDIYEAAIYSGRPMPSKEPMTKETFRLDAAGLGACYDTSSGVGVAGGGAADRGGRKTGLPFWILPAIACVGVVLLGLALVRGPRYFMSFFIHKPSVVAKPVQNLAPSNSVSAMTVPVLSESVTPPLLPRHSRTTRDTNELYCTGYTVLSGNVQAYLSDGRTVDADDGLSSVSKTSIILDGIKITVHLGKTVSAAYQPYVSPPLLLTAPPPPVNQADVTVIGDSYRNRTSPPKLGGFSTMSKSSPGWNSPSASQ